MIAVMTRLEKNEGPPERYERRPRRGGRGGSFFFGAGPCPFAISSIILFMMLKGKTAVVVSGGGMKCAYSAGALVALGEKLHITTPDILIAASGGVGNSFYYLAGQYADIRKAWSRYLPSRDFIRYFPFPNIRIDYLIDEVFKRLLPLDPLTITRGRELQYPRTS